MRAQSTNSSAAFRGWVSLCGLSILAAAVGAVAKAEGDEQALFGDWKGQSIVVAKNSVAKDEQVVWHISPTKDAAKVRVKGDKIVNGRTITMGVGDWDYDKSNKTIRWKIPQGMWKVALDGNHLKGTLTLKDKTVFRRVSLEKSLAGEP